MAYDSTLYPPIVATYMPAFVGNECRIYFNISDYQSWQQGQTLYAQAIVNHQTTNASALNAAIYPLGIKQFSTNGIEMLVEIHIFIHQKRERRNMMLISYILLLIMMIYRAVLKMANIIEYK